MSAEPGRTLVVTNDYPPRRGGIESFVYALCQGLPSDGVVVYTARMPGSAAVDEAVGYPVVRDRRRTLLPTGRVAAAAQALANEHGCDRVLFGAAMPLGLLAARLRTGGARRVVGLTHGHEVWWSAVPGARRLLRRVGRDVDVLTFVSEYCRARISSALRASDAAAMQRLSPGVDGATFRPSMDGAALRRRLGIEPDQPLVLSAARLVARKGHDVLLRAWPTVHADHPRAVLVIVGDGPMRRRLGRAIARADLADSVRLVRGVPMADMPEMYAAADVFALPCRTRLFGLEPEALGIVFLEAAAAGLPVVVGDSGGAPETVVPRETGFVVDPRSPEDVARAVSALLDDPDAAREMGRLGRDRVLRLFTPQAAVDTLRRLLTGDQE